MLGAHAHEGYSNHFVCVCVCVSVCVCVCVCLEFAAFNSRLYIKYDYFSPVFRTILYVVERILYDAHFRAESAIIFPRSSLQAVSAYTWLKGLRMLF